ncbi:hypothetical protein TWF569_000203 [Orbilia oligospora]|uniref:F-box domain-containing protein n=1 Tax=Orbilia oligospora TaxID=2813651 RepID=A0A7C8IZ86_ORBOL|nr:hypothetical protein TWF102_003313 [Orbilia oligospora]KAF3109300.1 hypothetical protein TWF103_005177 [Orbilia oligospora]KAF3112305.1 hypothetical protein TWF706_010892 [Orbilia oligospora]KAF3150470.1 hypothetical protein TWF594_009114 [Orbilia oligospora]KAF3157638.1 hypothetical protein TWF569_000203 [Orbilia oligospora]
MSLERIPLEIEQEVLGYLNKSDILNLVKCNSQLHDHFVSYLYAEILLYFPDGLYGVMWKRDKYYRPTEKSALYPYSQRGLSFVRHFSIITRDTAVRTGNPEARNVEDDLTKELYTKVLLPISRNDVFTRFQWHRADGKTPSFMPQILENSRNLVSLSIDLNVTSAGVRGQSYDKVQLPSLQKIRLMIKRTEKAVKAACTLLAAAPGLIDVDLDFLEYQEEPTMKSANDQEFNVSGSKKRRDSPDPEEDSVTSFDYSVLAKLPHLQRLGVSEADCGEIMSSIKIGNLKDITFRSCSNWKALAEYAIKQRLRLKHLHISAVPAELPAIKSFLDNGLEPGLETLIVTIHTIDEDNTFFLTLRKEESRHDSIYFLKKKSIMKHTATLRSIAFYVAIGRDDIEEEPDAVIRYISVLPYLPNIREMLNNSRNMRELSLVVPVLCARDYMYEIEVDSLRGLRLDTIEVLYLIPTSWPEFVCFNGTDYCCPEDGVRLVIIDFLEAAFQHYTQRPKLKYVIFGLQNQALAPSEYKIEWLEGITQQEKDMEGPGNRDQYLEPADRDGTWIQEVLSYNEYPEETNVELFHHDWMVETCKKRVRRKKAGVYPIQWNPHLHEADIAKDITHGGPKGIPFRLYSAQYQKEEELSSWEDSSLIGNGLSMY